MPDAPAVKRALAALANEDVADESRDGASQRRGDETDGVDGEVGRPGDEADGWNRAAARRTYEATRRTRDGSRRTRAASRHRTRPRAAIDEAEAAATALPTAATFVREGGLERLERAVDRAADRETERRGQRVLAAFERLRAVGGAGEPSTAGDGPSDEHHPRSRDHHPQSRDPHPRSPDHFRSGHGTDI